MRAQDAEALKRSPFTKSRTRKCAVCRDVFAPRNMSHKVCSSGCGLALAAKDRLTRERKAGKARKDELQPLEHWVKQAEKAFNAYIRARDAGQGCISCGRHNAEVWNAGHYVSVGANRTLRFNEDNVHLQCARPCNKDKGGNVIEYRKALLLKIGAERLAVLEGWHAPEKMTAERAKAIKAEYVAKLKSIKGN